MSEHIVGVNNSPKVYNGKRFRSILEVDAAKALDILGVPWDYEVKTYTLLEGFYCPWQKRKVESIEYTPDFIIGPLTIEMKGYETPDWKIKKKIFFKYLLDTAPDTLYYIAKSVKHLIQILDKYWEELGFYVEVTSRGSKTVPSVTTAYKSIEEAMNELGLAGRPMGSVLRSLLGKAEWIYGYNWKLKKKEDGHKEGIIGDFLASLGESV